MAGTRLGGHTLLEHVGKHDLDLASRLVRLRRLPAASTFIDLSEAQAAVSDVVRMNKPAIMRWLKTASVGDKARFSEPFPGGVGRVMLRGTTVSVPGKAVRVVLKKRLCEVRFGMFLQLFRRRKSMEQEPERFPFLSDLMACYFNQDFDYMFDSEDAALDDFAAHSSWPEISALIGELDTWLATGTEGLLSRFTTEVSKWDMTIGFSDEEARGWLQHARDRLAKLTGQSRTD